MKQVNAGIVQDIHHYALAMTGSDRSTFPSETIEQRLRAAADCLQCLEEFKGDKMPYAAQFHELLNESWRFTTLEQMERVGRNVICLTKIWGGSYGIDPFTGEKSR